jgi:hypothetical protein
MSTRTPMWAIMIAALTLVAGLAGAGQPETPANWAQVDRTETWVCPTPTGTTGTFFDVPGLALSFSTRGGPVMLKIHFSWHGTAGTGVWLEPVIDGQQLGADRLSWQTGNDGFLDIIAFERVYPLPAGSHTFGVRLSCQNTLTLLRGWLTVYELPSVRR